MVELDIFQQKLHSLWQRQFGKRNYSFPSFIYWPVTSAPGLRRLHRDGTALPHGPGYRRLTQCTGTADVPAAMRHKGHSSKHPGTPRHPGARHICTRTALGLDPPCRICIGTGLAPATSTPGLGPPRHWQVLRRRRTAHAPQARLNSARWSSAKHRIDTHTIWPTAACCVLRAVLGAGGDQLSDS